MRKFSRFFMQKSRFLKAVLYVCISKKTDIFRALFSLARACRAEKDVKNHKKHGIFAYFSRKTAKEKISFAKIVHIFS